MNTRLAQNLLCFENDFCVCMLYIHKEISTLVHGMMLKSYTRFPSIHPITAAFNTDEIKVYMIEVFTHKRQYKHVPV